MKWAVWDFMDWTIVQQIDLRWAYTDQKKQFQVRPVTHCMRLRCVFWPEQYGVLVSLAPRVVLASWQAGLAGTGRALPSSSQYKFCQPAFITPAWLGLSSQFLTQRAVRIP